ncbi:ABC transporter ATP-binding protein [Pusillimonas noertemannii]|uniref:Branched-chain amino acid transport system ATP-binding protein n=1 Tax=Pusillimonas noertemannii TaxID=305977 RepID=A0A2U1CP58_9BURK|nr:ABC transporter ATP-binding protein [Pusillimonas noertemannii]NYT67004.1 ABC transporter ATP-binding protein [Pusillimonas noertemannii]PVY67677.1 branched-chain amino acid transport system ATP-binding protein [Pusillimonas noertemannii]TFL12784.1 ABC transporter ATP-binding protein [Pusillimonas noertemannii]
MANDLVFDHVTAGYGPTVVLDDLSLGVGAGECLALLGRNGVGKTTLLLTAMGHTVCSGGSVRLGGVDITRWPIWKRSRFGVGLVPQEREIFPSLSVEENLQVAARSGGFTVEQTYDLFPRLAERRRNKGNQLSGGEQQMLSIGRAMMGGPKLLLLDEPMEGLAPVIVDIVIAALHRIRQEQNITMILVEQQARLALEFAPRAVVLVRGRIAYDGSSAALLDDQERLDSLIGVRSEAAA